MHSGSNIQIVVVIAVLLLGLVFRRAGGRKSPRAPMPPFGGGGDPFRRPAQRGNARSGPAVQSGPDRSVVPAMTHAEPPRQTSPPAEDTGLPWSELNRRSESRMQMAGAPDRFRETMDRPQPVSAPGPASRLPRPGGQDVVVQGIIWSEVLGPPRAKRPYKPR